MFFCLMLLIAQPELVIAASNPDIVQVEPAAKPGVPGRRVGGGSR